MKIKDKLSRVFKENDIVILGYGVEGKSSYKLIRNYFPEKKIIISDRDTEIKNSPELDADENIELVLGDSYLNVLNDYNFILKTPGISLKNYEVREGQLVSSQTDIFIQLFRDQIIGVTGTKGKSTTSSLIAFILSKFQQDVHLIGNIGKPAFNSLDDIKTTSIIVYELSSHQLEFVNKSPRISVLLNLYQEHLDHYKSYFDYKKSKFNIALNQGKNDIFITNSDNKDVVELVNKFNLNPEYFTMNQIENQRDEIIFELENSSLRFYRNDFPLVGIHNLQNLLVALKVVSLFGFDLQKALKYSFEFDALEHRLEFVGEFNSIIFYNDSIATIPEASISAVESIGNVNHLIIGGFNRGIDYSNYVNYLINKKIKNLYLIDEVGALIYEMLNSKSYQGNYKITNIPEAVEHVFKSPEKGVCLLSPAARTSLPLKSYKERGSLFKEAIKKYS